MLTIKNMIIYLCLVCIFGFYSNPVSAQYLKESVDAMGKLPANTTKLTKIVKNDVGDLTDSTVKGLTGDEGVNAQGGIVEDYSNKKNLRIAASKFSEFDATNADILQNPDKYTNDDQAKALNAFNKYAADEFGVKNTNGVSGYNGTNLKGTDADKAISNGEEVEKSNLNGLYDIDNKTIGINQAKQDGSTEKLVKDDAHEFNHYLQDTKGTAENLTPVQKETGSDRFSNQTLNALTDEIGSGAPVNTDHQDWVKNQDFSDGNILAADAKNVETLPANELVDNGQLSSGYGPRNIQIGSKVHKGDDIITNSSDKTIYAAADGKIVSLRPETDPKTGNFKGYGNNVVVEHEENGEKYRTVYAHLKNEPNLELNQAIQEGDSIGTMGSTGTGDGQHLHFEIQKYNPVTKTWEKTDPGNPKKGYVNIGNYNTLEEAKAANGASNEKKN